MILIYLGTKECTLLKNSDTNIIRGWQGHKIEKRCFVVGLGQFEIRLVKIDDFENPSSNLPVEKFILDAQTMDCLAVEAGYATSIQALNDSSKLIVFSNFRLGEVDDDHRFDSEKWK